MVAGTMELGKCRTISRFVKNRKYNERAFRTPRKPFNLRSCYPRLGELRGRTQSYAASHDLEPKADSVESWITHGWIGARRSLIGTRNQLKTRYRLRAIPRHQRLRKRRH